jgi:type IV secretion system protein TrbL
MAGPGLETPNTLMVVFSNTVTAGFDALSGPVNSVFGLMIALVVALTGIQWALSPNRDILAAGFGKVLLVGAFAWLINDWQALSETLYAGFIELGLAAGGGGLSRADFLNPGAILQQGWEIVKALGETPAPVDNPLDVMGNLADALILGLAMIGIILAFAVLALQIIVSLLEFKIVTLGGFVLLPFGIWNKTAFLAERPLGYVVSAGLKVLALAIVVSGAQSIFDQLQPSANPDIYEALALLVAALLLAMLAIFIPNLASALVTGGPALGAGAALTGGLAVAGAGALAAGGVAAAGAALGARGAVVSGASRSAAGAPAARPSAGPPPGGSSPSGGPRPSPPSGPDRAASPAPPSSGPPSGPSGSSPPPSASASPAAGPRPPHAPPGSPFGSRSDTPSGGPSGTSSGANAAPRSNDPPGSVPDAPAPPGSRPAPYTRSAALQAFVLANTGRSLMPAAETSGTLAPSLRPEDA